MQEIEFISCESAIEKIKESKVVEIGEISFNESQFYVLDNLVIVMPLNQFYSAAVFSDYTKFQLCVENEYFPMPKDEFGEGIQLYRPFEHVNFLESELNRLPHEISINSNLEDINLEKLQLAVEFISKQSNKDSYRLLSCYLFGALIGNELGLSHNFEFAFFKNLGALSPTYEPVLIDTKNNLYYRIDKYSWRAINGRLNVKEAILLAANFPKNYNPKLITGRALLK